MSNSDGFKIAGPRKSNSPRQEASDTNAPPSIEAFIRHFPTNWCVYDDTYSVFFRDWMPTADVDKFQTLVDDLNNSGNFGFHFHLVRRSGYNFTKTAPDGSIIFTIYDGDLCLLTSDQLSNNKYVISFISVRDDNFDPLYLPVPEPVETHEQVQADKPEPTSVPRQVQATVSINGTWSPPRPQPSSYDTLCVSKQKYEKEQENLSLQKENLALQQKILAIQQEKTEEAYKEWHKLHKEHQNKVDSLSPPVKLSEDASASEGN